MATSFKTPPIWKEDQPFHAWKSETEVWEMLTDLPKEKRGLAVALSLCGRRREAPAVLGSETGLTQLLTKLETVFAKDTVDLAFESYCAFENLQRLENQTVAEYIQNFERCYNRVEQNKMKLPIDVLACKLLNGAKLDEKERQMVLATSSKLEFELMKSSLKRIFSMSVSHTQTDALAPAVKMEPAFAASSQDGHEQDTAFWANRGKSFSRRKFNDTSKKRGYSGTNPNDSLGKISTCDVCRSRYHWRRNCPEKDGGPPIK